MDQRVITLINACKEGCLAGMNQPKQVVLSLLSINPSSKEALYARSVASEVTHETMKGRGHVSYAIGIDFAPCGMSCKFCSFGKKWGLITERNKVVFTHGQIIGMVREHIAQGASAVILRTTEFYPHEDLLALVKRLREEVPGRYPISVNTGELTDRQALDFYNAGVQGAIHMLRLREGIDTPFDPEIRRETIRVISESPLQFTTCIDPIGAEHTNEEIADLLLTLQSYNPVSISVQKRVNVKGTPFEGSEEVSKERLLLIEAVVRLCSGKIAGTACHPGYEESLKSGGCAFNVETGAVPRDSQFVESEWHGFDVPTAIALLEKAGYRVDR
jgi:biotin synthase